MYDDTVVDANDLAIAWSAQRWCESRLCTAFMPRVSRSGHNNIVVASGDATDTLSLEDLSTIDECALLGKSRAATFLDESVNLLVVVTVTGQLIVWNREKCRIELAESRRFEQLDRAMDISACAKCWRADLVSSRHRRPCVPSE